MTAEIVTLRDDAVGSSAQILVSQGFNCFRFTAVRAGRPVEVLYAPADFASGNDRPSRGGIPILFPFPGRIAGTIFRWQGHEYTLEPGDAFGNAIHGFVLSRPWRVIELSGNRVVGQFHASQDVPSLRTRWPADFRITATYTLSGNELQSEFFVENTGNAELPCGLGAHPYFHLPLGGTAADNCVIRLPVSSRWELKEMLPTSRLLDLPDAAAYQQGQRFADLKLDDVFSGLKRELPAPDYVASIADPGGGCLVIRFDDAFRECVVYTPPHREAICIEPYTCVAGAFDLDARGIDAGVRKMPPGTSFRAAVCYRLS